MTKYIINEIEELGYILQDGEHCSETSFNNAIKFFKENHNFPPPLYVDCDDGDVVVTWEKVKIVFKFIKVDYYLEKENNKIKTGSVQLDELKSLLEKVLVDKIISL